MAEKQMAMDNFFSPSTTTSMKSWLKKLI